MMDQETLRVILRDLDVALYGLNRVYVAGEDNLNYLLAAVQKVKSARDALQGQTDAAAEAREG